MVHRATYCPAGACFKCSGSVLNLSSAVKLKRAPARDSEHLYDAIVEGGADAVLMASITHFENYTIRQIKEYLASRGIPVNL